MLSRRGVTLVELVVAMALGGIVLATAITSVVRRQRALRAEGTQLRAESQQRAGLAELAGSLAGLAPGAGDLAAGAARDTAIQMRAPIVNGFACDSAVAAAVIAVGDSATGAVAGVASLPAEGDTLWWYGPDTGRWEGRRISQVSPMAALCGLWGTGTASALRIAISGADTIPRGAPLRITRQMRYSVYRAGDGSWQLGLSEWSEQTHRFAPPQPIAGPFVLGETGSSRTGFRYIDMTGQVLAVGADGADVARIARIRVTMLAAASAGAGAAYADSFDVALERAPVP